MKQGSNLKSFLGAGVLTALFITFAAGCSAVENTANNADKAENAATAESNATALEDTEDVYHEEASVSGGDEEAEAALTETLTGTTEEAEPDAATENEAELSEHDPVHGVYLSAYVAGSTGMMDEIISKMDECAINAVVIDVKNDEGRVTFETGGELVEELGSCEKLVRDMPSLVDKLHEHGIYVIGRFVTFREMYLKNVKPEWMIRENGKVYTDKKGFCWIDPTNEEAWKYIEEIVSDCIDAGFDEIQFDYVRYGTGVKENMIGLDGEGKQEAITAFSAHMEEFFSELGKPYSLDVFGTVIGSDTDRKIVGQDYAGLSVHTDYLSPMVYPSHYYDGSYGIAYPDEKPYDTVRHAMDESNDVLDAAKGEGKDVKAQVRPWIQGFTASYLSHYIKYGGQQIRDQILASYEAGHKEWLIWNPSCKYPWDELTEEKLPHFEEAYEKALQKKALDEPEAEKQKAAESVSSGNAEN
ncbi:MAG: sugar fermentation stimulation protein [Lachnospiraceae bacterium]|nr:sugar fermentation stimulation protein [Lachnospiraceae bacterium]